MVGKLERFQISISGKFASVTVVLCKFWMVWDELGTVGKECWCVLDFRDAMGIDRSR